MSEGSAEQGYSSGTCQNKLIDGNTSTSRNGLILYFLNPCSLQSLPKSLVTEYFS